MNDVGFRLFHGLLTSLGFPIPSVKCDHMVPRIVSEVMDTQIPLPGISLSFISKECSSAGGASRSARAPCGDAAGPRRAEPELGADSAAAAPRSLCGPGRPRRLWPRLAGRDVHHYWSVWGRRRSPLARGSVGPAGGVPTQVPAGAEKAVLTGPAGPGPGASRGFCAASRPGRR